MTEGVEQAALGRQRQMFVVGLLIRRDVAGEKTLAVEGHLVVDAAEHMVQRGPAVEAFQPRLEPGHKIALDPEPDVETAGEGLPRALHQGDVGRKLGVAHPDLGRPSVRERRVAGENQAAQTPPKRMMAILLGLPDGMFAEGSVGVGFVEQGRGNDGHPERVGDRPAEGQIEAGPQNAEFPEMIPRISLLGALVFGLSAGLPAAPRKIIVDQDAYGPGGSNQQALLLVLQTPGVEVLGITVESGDGWQEENVAHTLRMLELVGRTDIRVYRGATHPLLNSKAATERWESRHGPLFYKGAWTEKWPDTGVTRAPYHPPEVVPPLREGAPGPGLAVRPESAVDFLLRSTRENPGEVSILALGPLTNLALAVRLDDGFAARTRELVVMGGSFNPRPADNAFAGEYAHSVRLEFNFRWDPEAARIVLRSAWPRLVLVPIDPTTATFFRPELFQKISASSSPVARYVTAWAEGYPMWDELAAAALLAPGLITQRSTMAVDVDTGADGAGYGNTLSWPAGRGPGLGERDVEVVFAADVARFEDWCVTRLSAP